MNGSSSPHRRPLATPSQCERRTASMQQSKRQAAGLVVQYRPLIAKHNPRHEQLINGLLGCEAPVLIRNLGIKRHRQTV